MRGVFRSLLAAVTGVIVLTLGVLDSRTLNVADAAVNREVHRAAAGEGDVGFTITALADTRTVVFVTVCAIVLLLALRRWHAALALALAVPLTQLVVQLLKSAVDRPRPELSLTHAGGQSFPSGHSATSVALYALLAYALARGRARHPVAVAGVAVAFAVGLSRVWLGAHYPTDVLAGWLVGGVLAASAWLTVGRVRGLMRRSDAAA